MQPNRRLSALSIVALLTVAVLVPLLGGVQALPSGCTVVGIEKLHWLDEDRNGHLDAIVVDTNVAVEKSTVYPSDFNFGTSSNPRRGTGIAPPATGTATSFKLFFPESMQLDAGPTSATAAFAPAMAYEGQPDGKVHIRAAGGNPDSPTGAPAASCFSQGSGIQNLDEAAPILLAAYATSGASTVTAVFSEPVLFSSTDPNAHFCFIDGSNSAGSGERVFTGTIGSTASQTVSLNLGTYVLTSDDVDVGQFAGTTPVSGANLPARLYAQATGACGGGTASYTDTATPANTGIVPTTFDSAMDDDAHTASTQTDISGAVPVGGPVPITVSGSPTDRHVYVQFSGPVTTPSGTAIAGGFSVSPSTPPANWAVQSVSHSIGGLGGDILDITTVGELPATPHDIFVQPNAIVGTGTTAAAPQSTWEVNTGASPYIVRMETVDADLNGCVDAVRVTWNAYVDDSSISGTWATHWPNDPSGPAGTFSTGGSVGSGASAILLLPNVVDDRTTFLAYPGAANTPGNAACHGTGATGVGGFSILPRVSFTPSGAPTVVMHRDAVRDGAAPAVVSIATRDCMVSPCSPNGKIDGIEVTFSEPVADAAFRAADWRVEATGACTTTNTAPGVYTISGTNNLGNPDNATKGLVLTEGAALDTGCIPDVSYTGTAIVDAAGKVLPPIAKGPRLVGTGRAQWNAGTGTATIVANLVRSNQVELAMQSRMVADATAGPASTTLTSASGGFQAADVGRQVTGTGFAADTFVTGFTNANSVTISPATASAVNAGAKVAWFDFAAAGITAGTPFQITAASTGTAVGNYTVLSATATTLQYSGPDPGASVSFHFIREASEVDRAGPVLTQLLGTVGSTAAQAVFSEKVCGGSGLPESCPDIQVAAFQYVDTASGGASAVNAATRLASEPNKVDLTLSAALVAGDVSGHDCMRLVPPTNPGRVGTGIALTDVGPSATSTPTSGFNVPYPAQANPCVEWTTSGALRVGNATTIDSNGDGYLDAIRVTVVTAGNVPANIRDGTRLLRFDAGTIGAADGADTIYYDVDGDGTVSAGDRRLTAFGATAPGTVSCGSNADCGYSATHSDPAKRLSTQYNVLWADADLSGVPTTDLTSTDGLYADRDSSNTVSTGDFRYWDASPAGAGSTVACAAPADNDCGRALTPTSFHLEAARFTIGTIVTAHTQPVVQCVITGKAAGPVLGGPASTCGGVTGNPTPVGGEAPGPLDSCAGELPSSVNDNVFYVCFTPWAFPESPFARIPNTGYLPQLTYAPTGPTSVIRAASGESTLGGFVAQTTDGARPALVRASIEGGSRSARLTFSEPVGAAQSGIGGSAINPTDLAYINGNAGTQYCRSGVDAIASVATLPATTSAGTGLGLAQYNVTINFQGNLSHEDVVGCVQNPPPASTTPSRDTVRATPGLMERGANRAVDPKAVPFTDNDKPRIESASFIDANGDGTLDAVRLVFSEAINDCFGPVQGQSNPATWPATRPPAAFPTGPLNCATPASGHGTATSADPTHSYGWMASSNTIDHRPDFEVKVGVTPLAIKHIVTGQPGTQSSELCHAHYDTVGKPANIPDSTWLAPLALVNDQAATFGAPDGFNDNVVFLCLDPDSTLSSSGRGTKDLGTGVTGTYTYTANSALACDSPSAGGRPICDTADIGPDTNFVTMPANALSNAAGTITDAARPVVLTAATDDRDHNGKVDSVKVSFSEPIKPSSFSRADWSVETHPISGIDTTGTAGTACSQTSTVVSGLDRFWLCFAEVEGASTYDTDMGRVALSGPRVTYVSGGGLVDMVAGAGANRLRAYDTPATDGAQPVVVRLQATPGSATATVTFSEPVDGTGNNESPPTLSITYNDLYYENRGGTSTTATGFGNQQVVHSPGDRAAALTLNAPASQADIDNDKVCFVAGAIKEHGAASPLALFDTCFRLNGVAGDRQPPAGITNLALDRANSTATQIGLMWTTPGDNDLGRLVLYGCTCPIPTTATASTIATIAAPVGTPPAPVRNTVQRMQVPAQATTLNFTLVVEDQAGNGVLSNRLTVPPLDAVKPASIGAITVVSETSPTGDRVSLSWTAVGDDGTTGKVDHYNVHKVVGNGPITALSTSNRVAASNLEPDITGSQAAGNIVASGGTQSVTITGLVDGTTYTFVVVGVDEQGNEANLQGSVQKTVTPTSTGGRLGPETIPVLTAQAGTPPTTSVMLSWPAPRAPGNPAATPSGYKVYTSTLDLNVRANQDLKEEVLASRLTYTPSTLASPGQNQQVLVSGLDENTTHYFLVVATDQAGQMGALGGVASLRTAADPAAIQPDTVSERNQDIKVKVTPDGNGTGNIITWTLPAEDPQHPTQGVQVWRCTGTSSSTCVLIATLAAGSSGYTAGSYTDVQGNATHSYLVTAYYGTSPAKGYAANSAQASQIPGFSDLRPAAAGDSEVPAWLWIVLAAVVLILLIAAIVWAVRSKRAPAEEPQGAWPAEGQEGAEGMEGQEGAEGTEGAWPTEDAQGQPGDVPPQGAEAGSAAAAARAGPPKHYITCPKCSTHFSAIGTKPLAIQCPSCGVRGTLK